MEFTENLKLKKPLPDEPYSVEDFNENADAIDRIIHEMKTERDSLSASDIGYTDTDNLGASTVQAAIDKVNKTVKDNKATTDKAIEAKSSIFVGDTAPAKTGGLWVDTGNYGITKYYNGSSWVPINSIPIWG